MAASSNTTGPDHKLAVLWLAVAGSLVAGLFFVLCWLGALLPLGPATHMYLQLFTNAKTTSLSALAQGLCWSLLFGLIAGTLIAVVYNALGFLGRR